MCVLEFGILVIQGLAQKFHFFSGLFLGGFCGFQVIKQQCFAILKQIDLVKSLGELDPSFLMGVFFIIQSFDERIFAILKHIDFLKSSGEQGPSLLMGFFLIIQQLSILLHIFKESISELRPMLNLEITRIHLLLEATTSVAQPERLLPLLSAIPGVNPETVE